MSQYFSRRARLLWFILSCSILMTTACGSSGSGGASSSSESNVEKIADESGSEKINPVTSDITDATLQISSLGFVETSFTSTQLQQYLSKYSYIDSKEEIPTNLLARALGYFDQNKNRVGNQHYLAVIDFSKSSAEKRFFIIRLQDGLVYSYHLAHGSGSDPKRTGSATLFGNMAGSNMSSLGFYLTAQSFTGNYGAGLKLDGLSKTNSNARLRGLKLYGAPYVLDADQIQGMSSGSFVLPSTQADQALQFLSGKALIYAGQSSSFASLARPTPATPTPTPAPTPSPTPAPTPTPDPSTGFVVEASPLWEAKRLADGRSWTLHSFDVVKTYGTRLLQGTSDMGDFCPLYSSLTTNQKINFWVYLVSAVAKYESGFNPLSRYQESTMGTDAITGLPVYSEGLLQLSYQDIQGYPFCEFNWSVDQNLSPTDPKKTILDPYKNLSCGIRILNKIVGSHNLIAFNTGHYWSTLQPKNSTEQGVRSLVNQIPFCHN